MCAFDDKRFLLEDGVNSLAFGHKDIPVRVEDVDEDEQGGNGEVVVTRAEAREQGILAQRHPDDAAAANPRPPCIWQQRRRQRVENAKDYIRTQLGFGEDDDDVDEDELEDSDGDEEDEGAQGTRTAPRNPFILDSATVERSRKRNARVSDSDSD